MNTVDTPGQGLRGLRQQRGLTLKEVETRSRAIAAEQQNPEYVFTAGRLSQVENSNSLPSLYKLATLSQIYGVPYEELLRIYGVDLNTDLVAQNPPCNGQEAEARAWA